MKKQNLIIRLAGSDDFNELCKFRVKQFKDNDEYILKDASLLKKQDGFIYIIEIADDVQKKIISTMQVECIRSARDFNNAYSPLYKIELNSSFFPTYYISKVATEKNFRAIGLNTFLRLEVLLLAISKPFIKTLTGVVFENSSRVQLMYEIGYERKEMDVEKSSYLLPMVPTYFTWLERQKFSSAVESLRRKTKSLEETYDICNEVDSSSI